MMTENVRQGDEAGEEPGSVPAAIATEAEKGYGFLVIGREPASEESVFHDQITASTREFSGPFAITIVRGIDRADSAGPPLNILVPVAGTATSRRGAELAVTLAQAARGTLTAPHFTPRTRGVSTARSWRRNVGAAIAPTSGADAVIREIVRLGDLYGVAVKGAVQSAGAPHDAILQPIERGGHNLLVMGVSMRPGDRLNFGQTAAALLKSAQCSMFVVSEQRSALSEKPIEFERFQKPIVV